MVDYQMTFFMFFTKRSAPWIAAIATILTFPSFFCYLVLALFFTCLLLILSTSILFTLSKKTSVQNVLVSSEENIQPIEVKAEALQINTMSLQNKLEFSEENEVQDCSTIRSSDLYSKSETIDQFSTSTEDSDLDSGGASRMSLDFSDGSISDEESLFEIALPSGQYVGPKLRHKLPSFSAEAIFKQHGLMEFLAEFNEENLIEIDISMGSIKCSREQQITK